MSTEQTVVHASQDVAAEADLIFDLIADPARQPEWDGNDNLSAAEQGQRVRGVGEIFVVALTNGKVRENHVVEFEEGRRIAWRPASPGEEPAGHLWRWEIEPLGDGRCRVTHTYDWSQLHDERRFERARATTSERLLASVQRLAALAQG